MTPQPDKSFTMPEIQIKMKLKTNYFITKFQTQSFYSYLRSNFLKFKLRFFVKMDSNLVQRTAQLSKIIYDFILFEKRLQRKK